MSCCAFGASLEINPVENFHRVVLYSPPVQLELAWEPARSNRLDECWLETGSRSIRVAFVRHPRARRYILRLQPDGTARVTIPRGGSRQDAQRFAQKQTLWIERQLLRQASRPRQPRAWFAGGQILFRGHWVRLDMENTGQLNLVRFAGHCVPVADLQADLRPAVEGHLQQLAHEELPARTRELSLLHGFAVPKVSVRNQRTRWGSCSRRGTLSLNWRLVQTPEFVRDYIVIHELAHLRQMNHSRTFWKEVARLCPNYAEAENWIKQHSRLLL